MGQQEEKNKSKPDDKFHLNDPSDIDINVYISNISEWLEILQLHHFRIYLLEESF